MPIKTKSPLKAEEQQLVQLIVFRAGGEEFCVPIDAVQEIIKTGNITPIPDAPSFMRGLINVRGDIVAIIDVKDRFFLHDGSGMLKHIIITEQPYGLFGLMVEEVVEVLRVDKTEINVAPSIILKIHDEYVSGVVIHENRLLILLDLAKVLSQDELMKLSEITREQNYKTDKNEPVVAASDNVATPLEKKIKNKAAGNQQA